MLNTVEKEMSDLNDLSLKKNQTELVEMTNMVAEIENSVDGHIADYS